MVTDERERLLRRKVIEAAIEYYRQIHAPRKAFEPGGRIPYAGRVFDEAEIAHLIDASLDFWLTAGRFAGMFEDEFSRFLGVRHCSLTNSGSSANLLAFMALTSPRLGERRIRPGDEVITVAAGFPTTVAPIIQHGAVPVFVDVGLPTCNIDVTQLDTALSGRTRAVMAAHTLGNPFDLAAVKAFCDRHDLWLIEDNCDALGARYLLDGQWRHTGTIGHMGTSSFYPSHHMTMGEGGAMCTNDHLFKELVESFRDWGRDCRCPAGTDGICGNRFGQQFGELPAGYDHKYVYSHFGYNLRITEMQASIGCAQLGKLPGFIEARRRNWQMLRDGLACIEDRFILPEPTTNSEPSWFGFLLTLRERSGLRRDEIVRHLEDRGIQTRMLFAGNLVRQPCFDEMRTACTGYRIASDLTTTDRIMNDSFWIGVYPGMTEEMTASMIGEIRALCT